MSWDDYTRCPECSTPIHVSLRGCPNPGCAECVDHSEEVRAEIRERNQRRLREENERKMLAEIRTRALTGELG